MDPIRTAVPVSANQTKTGYKLYTQVDQVVPHLTLRDLSIDCYVSWTDIYTGWILYSPFPQLYPWPQGL